MKRITLASGLKLTVCHEGQENRRVKPAMVVRGKQVREKQHKGFMVQFLYPVILGLGVGL